MFLADVNVQQAWKQLPFELQEVLEELQAVQVCVLFFPLFKWIKSMMTNRGSGWNPQVFLKSDDLCLVGGGGTGETEAHPAVRSLPGRACRAAGEVRASRSGRGYRWTELR